ncbi:hypothetical protein B296_00015068 [Ensete ventricosum]|uniref:Uncharacterized protein n=1 Tax=Ensete ventricosum TaxID=4639 RepID=A0A427B735_ENSVE|nr:hypothetical protein B296_00015068 [Ensete ventricosum]
MVLLQGGLLLSLEVPVGEVVSGGAVFRDLRLTLCLPRFSWRGTLGRALSDRLWRLLGVGSPLVFFSVYRVEMELVQPNRAGVGVDWSSHCLLGSWAVECDFAHDVKIPLSLFEIFTPDIGISSTWHVVRLHRCLKRSDFISALCFCSASQPSTRFLALPNPAVVFDRSGRNDLFFLFPFYLVFVDFLLSSLAHGEGLLTKQPRGWDIGFVLGCDDPDRHKGLEGLRDNEVVP